MKKLLIMGIAVMAMLPVTASARGRVGFFFGPAFAPYGWYRPYYAPYYGFYPYLGPYRARNVGEVKIDTKVKDADVYIDDSYAGTTGHLKTMKLRPGKYDIEIRAPGRKPFEEKIYVVAGKTTKLHPDLRVENPPEPAGP